MKSLQLCLLICVACCMGCSANPNAADAVSGRGSASQAIDRAMIFVRIWPNEDAQLNLTRDAGGATVTLIREAREGRPRILLDSIGPGSPAAAEVLAMLDSVDVWALNAPNADGAACTTTNGRRSCMITFHDYSLVMRVESGRRVRVQRYTGLEQGTSNRSARALGDYILAWARRRDPARRPGTR